jgi:hypothetical protein
VDPSRAIAEAVKTLLTATTGYTVGLGEVPTPDGQLTYPYLVVWPPPVTRSTNALDSISTQHDMTWQVTAVGRDETETLAAADRATAALVDQVLIIAGRTFNQVEQVPTNQAPLPDPTSRDPATQRPVFSVPVMFSTWSVPG